ncbi:hypothetical protein [Pseudomonas sp. HY7a-MNA-CIBAN-0227]|uniref:hypothetical protein n=1 Tax=Pseudomonas sp. HY7a-MNA-CIBAN-0227 TaxID=3140474 RepID=UPI003321CC33
MKLSQSKINDLFEICEDLLALYAEKKIAAKKIPTKKQTLEDMGKTYRYFISSCNLMLNYSNETMSVYYSKMMEMTDDMVDYIIEYIEIEQQ